MPGMDIERILEFVVQTQAQFATDLQELRSLVVEVARGGAETSRLQTEQAGIVRNVVELVHLMEEDRRRAEADRRRAEEDRRRAEAENREAHRRYEIAHQEADERFSAIIKMMDEWIRESREKRNGQQSS